MSLGPGIRSAAKAGTTNRCRTSQKRNRFGSPDAANGSATPKPPPNSTSPSYNRKRGSTYWREGDSSNAGWRALERYQHAPAAYDRIGSASSTDGEKPPQGFDSRRPSGSRVLPPTKHRPTRQPRATMAGRSGHAGRGQHATRIRRVRFANSSPTRSRPKTRHAGPAAIQSGAKLARASQSLRRASKVEAWGTTKQIKRRSMRVNLVSLFAQGNMRQWSSWEILVNSVWSRSHRRPGSVVPLKNPHRSDKPRFGAKGSGNTWRTTPVGS